MYRYYSFGCRFIGFLRKVVWVAGGSRRTLRGPGSSYGKMSVFLTASLMRPPDDTTWPRSSWGFVPGFSQRWRPNHRSRTDGVSSLLILKLAAQA